MEQAKSLTSFSLTVTLYAYCTTSVSKNKHLSGPYRYADHNEPQLYQLDLVYWFHTGNVLVYYNVMFINRIYEVMVTYSDMLYSAEGFNITFICIYKSSILLYQWCR